MNQICEKIFFYNKSSDIVLWYFSMILNKEEIAKSAIDHCYQNEAGTKFRKI